MTKPEEFLSLPSETFMIAQWQDHPELFQQVAWSTKEGARSRIIFTVHCKN